MLQPGARQKHQLLEEQWARQRLQRQSDGRHFGWKSRSPNTNHASASLLKHKLPIELNHSLLLYSIPWAINENTSLICLQKQVTTDAGLLKKKRQSAEVTQRVRQHLGTWIGDVAVRTLLQAQRRLEMSTYPCSPEMVPDLLSYSITVSVICLITFCIGCSVDNDVLRILKSLSPKNSNLPPFG